MLLEVVDLRVDFGGARVLRGVSLSLAGGSVICLIGGNGAGKTTMLRTISGLKRPVAGRIRYQDRDISALPPPRIVALGIAHAPQEGRIFRDMTVFENLSLGAFSRPDDLSVKKDMEQVFTYFPVLQERTGQRAGSLSGGERQMLAVGRALMSRPKVLMLDEPTAGLAPIIVSLVGRIIRRLNRDGLSIILVEQNAAMALKAADYGYVLERGRIAIEGPTTHLVADDTIRRAYLGI